MSFYFGALNKNVIYFLKIIVIGDFGWFCWVNFPYVLFYRIDLDLNKVRLEYLVKRNLLPCPTLLILWSIIYMKIVILYIINVDDE